VNETLFGITVLADVTKLRSNIGLEWILIQCWCPYKKKPGYRIIGSEDRRGDCSDSATAKGR
jgi:hypothetical protein